MIRPVPPLSGNEEVQVEFREEFLAPLIGEAGRDENENPLAELATSPHGRLKIWYPRHDAPYGLVDSAALFDWALGTHGPVVERVNDWEELRGVPGILLLHGIDGFTTPPLAVEDTAEAAARWKQRGARLSVVVAETATGS